MVVRFTIKNNRYVKIQYISNTITISPNGAVTKSINYSYRDQLSVPSHVTNDGTLDITLRSLKESDDRSIISYVFAQAEDSRTKCNGDNVRVSVLGLETNTESGGTSTSTTPGAITKEPITTGSPSGNSTSVKSASVVLTVNHKVVIGSLKCSLQDA